MTDNLIQRDARQMIRVKKIAHATYETPDLDEQIEYYTDILGLNLVAREKDAAYLASTLDHHSVVLRKGSAAQCARLGFQLGLDDDLDAFEKQTAARGVKTRRLKDPEPTIADMVAFEDPKGTLMEVFKRPEPQTQSFPQKGIVHFVSGAGGALRVGDIRPSNLIGKGFDSDTHFMLMEISGDELYFQTISRKGQTVDSGHFKRREHAKPPPSIK